MVDPTQTLFRYLDKQPMAGTLRELQAQVDEIDRIYNTERPHQGLPVSVTATGAVIAHPQARPGSAGCRVRQRTPILPR